MKLHRHVLIKVSFPNVLTEAGVVLDLLDSLARHLTTLDVSSQRRLLATKYNLLSTKVDSSDKKQVHELAVQALESGAFFEKPQFQLKA